VNDALEARLCYNFAISSSHPSGTYENFFITWWETKIFIL